MQQMSRAMSSVLILAIAFTALLAPVALAGPTEADGTPIDERVYRAFESNWRKYARFASKNEAGYIVIPDYDRRKPSSLGLTEGQALDKLTKTWEERAGNLVTKRSKSPPREEAEVYSTRLPGLAVGNYGWLHSAEVVQVIDGKQMIVRELWLVDHAELSEQYKKDEERSAKRNNGEPDTEELEFNYAMRAKMVTIQQDRDLGFTKTFRLVGYDTRGLRPGDRWDGPGGKGLQVGVVQWETPEPAEDDRRRSRRVEPRLVLTELDSAMRQTLDEEGFKALLAERGTTVAAFVELMRVVREDERDSEAADARIVRSLLAPDQTQAD